MLLFALIISLESVGQPTPSIEHYNIYDYQAHPQNWAVVQDGLGRVYVGNTKGVLQYDGTNWDLITLPNLSEVRSLDIGSDGKIFVGGIGEVGYLDTNQKGKKEYISLLDKIPSKYHDFLSVWKTIATDKGIVFQSFEYIFWFDLQKQEVEVIVPTSQVFHLSFAVGDEVWVREWSKGLYRITPKGLDFIKGSEIFADEKIYAILPYSSGHAVVTERMGVFEYQAETSFEPMDISSDAIIRSSQVYCGLQLSDGRYVLGTRQKGILVLNNNFEFLFQLSSLNGLVDDKVAALYEDTNKQLWAALSNGLAYVDIASSFKYYEKGTGLAQNILSISPLHKGNVYIGTARGVFESDSAINSFSPIAYSESETWSIEPIQEQLLVAQSLGVALIENQNTELLAVSKAIVQDLLSPQDDTSSLIAVSSEGLQLLKKQNQSWIDAGEIEGFSSGGSNIAQDRERYLWVSDYNKGIFRLQLSEDYSKVLHSDFFGKNNGLPKDQGNLVFQYGEEVIFATLDGLYTFKNNEFFPHPVFSDIVDKKPVTVFEEDDRGDLWIVLENESNRIKPSQTLLMQLKKKSDGSYEKYDAPFKKIRQIVQAVRPLNENLVLIGTNEGMIAYNPKNTIADKQSFNVFISQIESTSGTDSLLFTSDNLFSSDGTKEIPYHLNSLQFGFGSSFFEERSEVYYQTKLEPLEEDWSDWTTKTQDKYTNLPNGDYTFRLRARNLYGSQSNEASFSFTIQTPWFRHPLFYLLLIVIAGAIIQLGVRAYTKRLKNEKQRLENLVRERTEDMRQAYFNTRVLSKVGQKITSTRSIDEITDMIYQHLSKLMDTAVFAIGIHNPDDDTIEFPAAIEKGEKLPFHVEHLSDTGRFAVWCFINEQDLFINDSESDYEQYVEERPDVMIGSPAPSLIYLPLKVKDKVIGVLTVQSYQKNAYDDYHLNLLRNLAVYTAIAIDNANSYQQINDQKHIIEEKNSQLISSINYAKRIQSAILPPLGSIQEAFKDSFVLFLPRDIVSGDFYYFVQKEDKVIISAIDCTGHGVPGAFMSMIGYELLNEIIFAKHISSPDKILLALHEGIASALRQDQTDTQDGMDMTLCSWDKNTNVLEIAAARNPLYLYNKNNEDRKMEVLADRQSIGGKMEEGFEFSLNKVEIQEGDTVYLLSDGFQDQFGGKEDRKYLRKRLRNFLESIQEHPLSQQRKLLQRELIEWKGNKEQVDDILVIGLRF